MRDWLSMKAGQISYVDTSDTLYVPEYKHIMRVPGGWIVVYKDTPVYVPEPKHEGNKLCQDNSRYKRLRSKNEAKMKRSTFLKTLVAAPAVIAAVSQAEPRLLSRMDVLRERLSKEWLKQRLGIKDHPLK